MRDRKLKALELAVKLATKGDQKDADIICRLLSSMTELEDQVALLKTSSDS